MKQTLKIEDYGYNGEGVGKINGKVCFVPKSIIGEVIEVKIEKENSNFYRASISNIITRSNNRVNAKCPYYDVCGGCNFQHIPYSKELYIKKSVFLREFSKIARLDDVEFIKSEKELGYRNKIRLAVKNKELGYYQEGTKEFVKVNSCLLASPLINKYIEKVCLFLKNSEYSFEEVVFMDFEGKCMLDFLTRDNVNFEEIKKQFDCKVEINHIGDLEIVKGKNLKLVFNGEAFRQVNDDVARKLYDEVVDNIEGETILNAYSGAGLLSAYLTQKARLVYGVEINKSAHAVAEELKKSNNIQNLINICGDAQVEIKKLKDLDCVIMDPPRSGCSKAFLDAVLDKQHKKIIYISCNISTLVRDLKILSKSYQIEKVKLFDMFPRTANFEIFVVLKKI